MILFSFFGLGKKRSKLGKWLDNRGISQSWLANKAGVSRNTINDLAAGDIDRAPTTRTISKIVKALKEIDPSAKPDDFFDM
ncbi:helix-turn-helix transcriptional regulator [Bacillus sp. ISL-77]|uniref:helix-turn-helix transcriptional regulator n=1 Tax=Bacillus sp. ISL-77 TaxID=2819138 RepID=UPI0035A94FD7